MMVLAFSDRDRISSCAILISGFSVCKELVMLGTVGKLAIFVRSDKFLRTLLFSPIIVIRVGVVSRGCCNTEPRVGPFLSVTGSAVSNLGD